jgi:hypothetical protein
LSKSFTTQAEIVFLPEEVIMKRNFLIAMAGISLALGMMAVGCDTGGGGGGSGGGSSRTFKDADGNVELTITERPLASTQAAYSITAPTSGEVFNYKLKVAGNQISSGTVTAGASAWSFVSDTDKRFTLSVSGSGTSLTFTSTTTIPADTGSSSVTIPPLSPPAASVPSNQLAGTAWEGGGMTMEITAAYVIITGRYTVAATYTLNGNEATMYAPEWYGGTLKGTFTGNTATVDDGNGGKITFTKKTGYTPAPTPASVVGTWEADITTSEERIISQVIFTDKTVTVLSNGTAGWTADYTLSGDKITVWGELIGTVSGNKILIVGTSRYGDIIIPHTKKS